MADDPRKRIDQAGVQAAAQQQGGLNAPLNPHTGQQNSQFQNILASAAGAMAGQHNPYMAELQRQQAAQAAALQQAHAAHAQQTAAAAAAAGLPAAPHAGPAAGGLQGNPLAPNAAQQMQQMGGQAAQQLTPDQLAKQRMMAAASSQAPALAVSDERLKYKVDRGGVEREMRRLLDSIGSIEEPAHAPSYDPNSLAARALKNG